MITVTLTNRVIEGGREYPASERCKLTEETFEKFKKSGYVKQVFEIENKKIDNLENKSIGSKKKKQGDLKNA